MALAIASQDQVADLVAVHVVQPLEVVHVHGQDRRPGPRTAGGWPRACSTRRSSAGWAAGELVGSRLRLGRLMGVDAGQGGRRLPGGAVEQADRRVGPGLARPAREHDRARRSSRPPAAARRACCAARRHRAAGRRSGRRLRGRWRRHRPGLRSRPGASAAGRPRIRRPASRRRPRGRVPLGRPRLGRPRPRGCRFCLGRPRPGRPGASGRRDPPKPRGPWQSLPDDRGRAQARRDSAAHDRHAVGPASASAFRSAPAGELA